MIGIGPRGRQGAFTGDEAVAGPLLVLGLGNPGGGYESQRHNVGARAVERLAARLGTRLVRGRSPAWTGAVDYGGRRLVLARPRTFMNESGVAGVRLLRDLDLQPSRLVVVYDDLDLPVGRLRVRRGGSPGGHNGIRSLQAHLRTQEFPRVRIGIGRPPAGVDPIEYVLGEPDPEERELLGAACLRAGEAVLAIASRGIDAAMGEFNRANAPEGGDGD